MHPFQLRALQILLKADVPLRRCIWNAVLVSTLFFRTTRHPTSIDEAGYYLGVGVHRYKSTSHISLVATEGTCAARLLVPVVSMAMAGVAIVTAEVLLQQLLASSCPHGNAPVNTRNALLLTCGI